MRRKFIEAKKYEGVVKECKNIISMHQEVVEIKLSCMKPYGLDFAKTMYKKSKKESEIKDDQPQDGSENV